jgi:hypothetical protein
MFRAQQNAFDDVVGKSRDMQPYERFEDLRADKRLNSQGDRREPHFRELGVYYGCLR